MPAHELSVRPPQRHGALLDDLSSVSATSYDWRIQLATRCADLRNQMTDPADNADSVVKMLNSGAPVVMLDLAGPRIAFTGLLRQAPPPSSPVAPGEPAEGQTNT